MTTFFINDYTTYSMEQTTPKWMREERYGYCEPTVQQKQTFKSFFTKLASLFL